MAADLSAFANTQGGYVLFGMEEAQGEAVAAPGITVPDLDAEKLRIDSVIRDLVSPLIAGVEIGTIATDAGTIVLAVRVPRSFARPHSADGRFYARNNAGKYQMDIAQLGAMFTGAMAFGEKAAEFHLHRASRIGDGHWAVSLVPHPRFVFHIIPVTAFEPGRSIDLSGTQVEWSAWQFGHQALGMDYRYNIDGLVTWGVVDGRAWDGNLLFRNGILEAIAPAGATMRGAAEDEPVIWGREFEKTVIEQLPSYLDKLERVNAAGPYVIHVSGVRMLNAAVRNEERRGPAPIDRQTIHLPDFLMTSSADDVATVARETFVALWQSGGFAG